MIAGRTFAIPAKFSSFGRKRVMLVETRYITHEVELFAQHGSGSSELRSFDFLLNVERLQHLGFTSLDLGRAIIYAPTAAS